MKPESPMRRLAIGAALAAVLCTTLPVAGAADAVGAAGLVPMLREQVVVAGGEVRLGDLFSNIAADASRIVAPAPAPGGRSVFDAAQLTAIAAANGVPWQARSRFERVSVERESRLIDSRQIERRLAEAITDGRGRREYDVELENRLLNVHVPVGAEPGMKIEHLRVDERGRRATAMLIAPDGDGGTTRTPVAGRLHPVVDVPVLRGPVMPGQAITEADLEWSSMRADRLRRDMITDARWLIGMTPRRAVTPGEPVNMRDLQERIVVEKNSMVTIVLRSGSLMLTARGKALDDGAEGAAIRVLNPRSERVVQATVVAPDTVEIHSMQFAARAAAGSFR